MQRIADRVSSVFVPLVLIGSVVTFLCWWLIVGDFGKAVLSAIALLLVACPCAMGLATPVAMMVSCGRASALGILVRGGDTLESLSGADTVVFDKTGTLTESTATVTGIVPAPGSSRDQVLELAAAVEADSPHPIAVAIREAGASLVRVAGQAARATETTEIPALGVTGVVDGRVVDVVKLGTTELPAAMIDEVARVRRHRRDSRRRQVRRRGDRCDRGQHAASARGRGSSRTPPVDGPERGRVERRLVACRRGGGAGSSGSRGHEAA